MFACFQVSQYTGRIHLYSCLSGTDSRPRPLFENFRPEELEPLDSSVANNDNRRTSIMDNPVCRNAVLEFCKEWNNLRPVERKKLTGKPLQLPLTIELCFLNESISHNTGVCLSFDSWAVLFEWMIFLCFSLLPLSFLYFFCYCKYNMYLIIWRKKYLCVCILFITGADKSWKQAPPYTYVWD